VDNILWRESSVKYVLLVQLLQSGDNVVVSLVVLVLGLAVTVRNALRVNQDITLMIILSVNSAQKELFPLLQELLTVSNVLVVLNQTPTSLSVTFVILALILPMVYIVYHVLREQSVLVKGNALVQNADLELRQIWRKSFLIQMKMRISSLWLEPNVSFVNLEAIQQVLDNVWSVL